MKYLLIILIALLLGGCGDMRVERTVCTFYFTDPNVIVRYEHAEASNWSILMDAERRNWFADVEGLGTIGIGISVLDAESIPDLPWWLFAREAKP